MFDFLIMFILFIVFMFCLKLCYTEITSDNNSNVVFLNGIGEAIFFRNVEVENNTGNTNIIENNIIHPILNQNNITSIINNNSFIYKNSDTSDHIECSICLDEMNDDQDIRRLRCLHIFHSNCIDKWLHQSTQLTCPLCNSLIMEVSI